MEYRICELCEQKNEVSFLVCENCGADISYIPPTSADSLLEVDQEIQTESPIQIQPAKTVRMAFWKLVSVKGQFVIEIPESGGVIGREGTLSPDYFQDNLYISNQHAEIKPAISGFSIIDHSTNGTKLDGVKLERGREYPLSAGGQVVFANMEFMVEG